MIYKPKKAKMSIPGLGIIEAKDWTPLHTEALRKYLESAAGPNADKATKAFFVQRGFKHHLQAIEQNGQVNMIPDFRDDDPKPEKKKRGPKPKKKESE